MPVTRKEDRWLSLVAAGALIGISRHTVLRMALREELESDQVAGRTVISRRSAERERRRRDRESAAVA